MADERRDDRGGGDAITVQFRLTDLGREVAAAIADLDDEAAQAAVVEAVARWKSDTARAEGRTAFTWDVGGTADQAAALVRILRQARRGTLPTEPVDMAGVEDMTLLKAFVEPVAGVENLTAAVEAHLHRFAWWADNHAAGERYPDDDAFSDAVSRWLGADPPKAAIDTMIADMRKHGLTQVPTMVARQFFRRWEPDTRKRVLKLYRAHMETVRAGGMPDPSEVAVLDADFAEFRDRLARHEYTRAEAEEVHAVLGEAKAVFKGERDALDAQIALLRAALAAYAHGPVQLIALEQQLLASRVNARLDRALPSKVFPSALQRATVAALKTATPYCWSPDCVEAVAAAGALLPETAMPTGEALGPLAGPGASGWWWFEQAIPPGDSGRREPVVALLWRREADADGPKTWFSAFVHVPFEEFGRTVAVPTPTLAWLWQDDWDLARLADHVQQNYAALAATGQLGADAWPQAAAEATALWFSRLFLAGGLWLQQRVLARNPVAVPRQPGRALARKHGLAKAPLVEVVHLRRPALREPESGAATAAREWTCRWIVRGFWRNQYYPGSGRHAPKWIDAYVKGPADRPLKTAARVYAVDR